MQIRPIDVVHDPAEFRWWYAITREALLFERPDAPVWSRRELQVVLSRADGAEHLTAYGAFEGETMLGAAMIALPLLDNLDKADLSVWVAPSRRRQGIGGALLEHLVSTSVGKGRTTMWPRRGFPRTRETTIRTACSHTSTGSPSPTSRPGGRWRSRCRTTGSGPWPPRRVRTIPAIGSTPMSTMCRASCSRRTAT